MGETQLPTPPSPVEPFDVDEVLKKLTSTEKIDLLAEQVLTFGIPRACHDSLYLRFDFQMARMEFAGLDFSTEV
ncbi:hypothetical protein D0Z07_8823 [Hyphodiscus hymeniophilus]|uniref:Uncharacterized protein n=1 Tax=Hyphodiscus hymeniophilus TaxID=353542 RepID=A0A9P6VDM0_9HELO|nr:hypothetical protein D0Z07_8823 [Hyphodiscus hymeniophilus]